MCIRAVVRLDRLKYGPETITVELSKSDPYRHKALRKVSVCFKLKPFSRLCLRNMRIIPALAAQIF